MHGTGSLKGLLWDLFYISSWYEWERSAKVGAQTSEKGRIKLWRETLQNGLQWISQKGNTGKIQEIHISNLNCLFRTPSSLLQISFPFCLILLLGVIICLCHWAICSHLYWVRGAHSHPPDTVLHQFRRLALKLKLPLFECERSLWLEPLLVTTTHLLSGVVPSLHMYGGQHPPKLKISTMRRPGSKPINYEPKSTRSIGTSQRCVDAAVLSPHPSRFQDIQHFWVSVQKKSTATTLNESGPDQIEGECHIEQTSIGLRFCCVDFIVLSVHCLERFIVLRTPFIIQFWGSAECSWTKQNAIFLYSSCTNCLWIVDQYSALCSTQ